MEETINQYIILSDEPVMTSLFCNSEPRNEAVCPVILGLLKHKTYGSKCIKTSYQLYSGVSLEGN